jgi:hypothetical protein
MVVEAARTGNRRDHFAGVCVADRAMVRRFDRKVRDRSFVVGA